MDRAREVARSRRYAQSQLGERLAADRDRLLEPVYRGVAGYHDLVEPDALEDVRGVREDEREFLLRARDPSGEVEYLAEVGREFDHETPVPVPAFRRDEGVRDLVERERGLVGSRLERLPPGPYVEVRGLELDVGVGDRLPGGVQLVHELEESFLALGGREGGEHVFRDAAVFPGSLIGVHREGKGLDDAVMREADLRSRLFEDALVEGGREDRGKLVPRDPEQEGREPDLDVVSHARERSERLDDLRPEGADPRGQELRDRVAHAGRAYFRDIPFPPAVERDVARFLETDEELADEERVVPRLVPDRLGDVRDLLDRAMQGRRHEQVGRVGVEGSEFAMGPPVHAPLLQLAEKGGERVKLGYLLVPVAREDEEIVDAHVLEKVLDEGETRLVRPMKVVEMDDERGTLAREGLDERDDHAEKAGLVLARPEFRDRLLGTDDGLDFRDEVDQDLAVFADPLENLRAYLLEPRLAFREHLPDQVFETLDPGAVGNILTVLLEFPHDEQRRLLRDRFSHLGDDAGLADPGGAREDEHAILPARGA